MSDGEPDPVVGPGTDLEYDLAHEATGPDTAVHPEAAKSREAVVTATPDYDGDYSYDLAHDIPGR
jgi:hypothetical protein